MIGRIKLQIPDDVFKTIAILNVSQPIQNLQKSNPEKG